MVRFWLAYLALLLAAWPCAAQPADSIVTAAVEMAQFERAVALAVDPAGILYVVDAGRDAVLRFSPDGFLLNVLGGPGSAEGEFDGPADIDPTNGLVLIVADAGNGRLQRFSREFMHLASTLIEAGHDAVGRLPGRPIYGADREGAVDFSSGRPIAVVSTGANETFAIDEARNVVLKWDAARRLERVIGGYDHGAGALVEPVALAVDPRRSLYVADRGQAAVLVYDLFGAYERTLAQGLARDVQAVTVQEDALWIVLPERLLRYETRGRLSAVLDVRLGEPLVDMTHHGATTYLLTATHLYRASF